MKKHSITLWAFLLGTLAAASLQAAAPHSHFNTGVYVGGALNFEHMDGHRTDGAKAVLDGIPYHVVYADNKGVDDNSFGVEAYMGYLYRFADSNFVVGLEPYFGYNDNESKVSALISEDERSRVSAKIKRDWNVGCLARLGYVFCDSYLLYAVVGPDWGHFKYDWRETHFDDNKARNRKWLTGIRYGLGLEKEFEYFRIGVQATMTNYKGSTLQGRDVSGDTVYSRLNPNIWTIGLRVSFPF